MDFNEYRVDLVQPSQIDARLTKVECKVRDSNNPDDIEVVRLEIDLTGLEGNARYSAIEAALRKARDEQAEIDDLKDLPITTWYSV